MSTPPWPARRHRGGRICPAPEVFGPRRARDGSGGGAGGLTRVVDKRKVRRDLADVFATRTDGVKARQALEWGLVATITLVGPEPADAGDHWLVGEIRLFWARTLRRLDLSARTLGEGGEHG